MLAKELAARFGPKLREIDPVGQRLPAAMSDLLRVIAQAEEPHSDDCDGSGCHNDAAERQIVDVGGSSVGQRLQGRHSDWDKR